ncbi:MAG TPA: DUF4241 domain-containing protein [Streptosporangiaceae bacterium]|nr:DUF4241 domain-containing protein [Streptosporangiaceae bacterium]
MELVVSYWEGWDAGDRRATGRLTKAAARRRDAAGEQYTVLVESRNVPRMLIDVAWNHHYCAVWELDEVLRRKAKYVYRRLADDQIFLTKTIEWTYGAEKQPEFHPHAGTRMVEAETDGRTRIGVAPEGEGGNLGETMQMVPADGLWRPVPAFGDWRELFTGNLETLRSAILLDRPDPVAPGAALPVEQRPWRPPRPLRPSRPDLMFGPGTAYDIPRFGRATVEVIDAGRLRMPTGRLIAADPGWLRSPIDESELPAFTVHVAPGEYPVSLSVVRFDDNPRHVRVAAAKLTVRTEPAATWEPALRPGEDPRSLDEGQFFGFGVDSGTGCFVDAAALPAIGHLLDDVYESLFPEVGGTRRAVLESGANVISFSSGWGDGAYPTWLGRTEGGQVACFIADMLVLDDATVAT